MGLILFGIEFGKFMFLVLLEIIEILVVSNREEVSSFRILVVISKMVNLL